jgi:hypothetical protein
LFGQPSRQCSESTIRKRFVLETLEWTLQSQRYSLPSVCSRVCCCMPMKRTLSELPTCDWIFSPRMFSRFCAVYSAATSTRLWALTGNCQMFRYPTRGRLVRKLSDLVRGRGSVGDSRRSSRRREGSAKRAARRFPRPLGRHRRFQRWDLLLLGPTISR